MDDIAREISISKKTIYQYFKDKNDLVSTVTSYHMENEREEFESFARDSKNAVDEILKVSACIRKNMKDINPSLMFDLKKYHKQAWDIWIEYKNVFIKNNIVDNLERGIREGFYRKEIDVEALAIFRVEQVQMTFDNTIYPKDTFSINHLQLQLFEHFVYGIFTDKGRKLYQQYLQEPNQ